MDIMGNEDLFKYMDYKDPVTPLPHAFYVDQAIMTEEDHLVVMRFGSNDDIEVQAQDEALRKAAKMSPGWAVYYRVDNRSKTPERPWCVPDFNEMYELYDRVTVMFFYRNKHMMCDLGTGNNNKIHFLIENRDEILDIAAEILKGAKKGKGLVPFTHVKDYSTRHAY